MPQFWRDSNRQQTKPRFDENSVERQQTDDDVQNRVKMSTLPRETSTDTSEAVPLLASPKRNRDVLREPSQIVRFEKLHSESHEASVDPLLKVVDRLEDDLDQPYEDLVPLEVKLALEERVFGWSHLSSDILGHIFFTAGAYCLVYMLLTNLLGSRLPEWLFRGLRFVLASWAGISAFRMVRRRRRVWLRSSYGSKDYDKDASRRMESIRESDRNTILGRIRRRRAAMAERGHQRKLRKAVARFSRRQQRHRDQLLQQQESESLFGPASPVSVCHLSDDEKEEENTEESDTTKWKDSASSSIPEPSDEATMVVSSVSLDPRALDAESTCPKLRMRKRRRRSFHASPTEDTKSIGHDEIVVSSGPLWKVPYAHGGFFGAAPFMLANPHWIDVLRLLMPDVYIEISRRVLHAPAPRLIHWAENNPVVAAFGTAHELENKGQVPNLEWDVFLDPHHVHRVEVVLDEQEKFLRSCAPDELQALSGQALRDRLLGSIDAIALSASQRSILQFYERELQIRVGLLVDKMLIAHGNLTQIILEQTGYAKQYNFSRVKRTRRTLGGGIYARQWLAIFAEALRLGMCLDSGHFSEEIPQEALGGGRSPDSTWTSSPSSSTDEGDDLSNSSRCDCLQCPTCILSRSESAGMYMDKSEQEQAETVFGVRPELKRSNTEGSPLRQRTSTTDIVSSTRALTTSIAESVTQLKSITHCDSPVGLVFDIKSRHVPHRVWGLVVSTLRRAGVRLEGIASFTVDEIRDISQFTTMPVKEVLFFHSAGDLQLACHAGQIKQGDTVFFNAGSLLWQSDNLIHPMFALMEGMCQVLKSFDAEDVKRSYHLLPFSQVHHDSDDDSTRPPRQSTIQQYKDKFNLSIGLYCQEFSIDEAAVNVLIEYVNSNRQLYNLGLSWGGVNGLTLRSIQPGRFTSTDGFWNQRYVGVSWKPELSPADIA